MNKTNLHSLQLDKNNPFYVQQFKYLPKFKKNDLGINEKKKL